MCGPAADALVRDRGGTAGAAGAGAGTSRLGASSGACVRCRRRGASAVAAAVSATGAGTPGSTTAGVGSGWARSVMSALGSGTGSGLGSSASSSSARLISPRIHIALMASTNRMRAPATEASALRRLLSSRTSRESIGGAASCAPSSAVSSSTGASSSARASNGSASANPGSGGSTRRTAAWRASSKAAKFDRSTFPACASFGLDAGAVPLEVPDEPASPPPAPVAPLDGGAVVGGGGFTTVAESVAEGSLGMLWPSVAAARTAITRYL